MFEAPNQQYVLSRRALLTTLAGSLLIPALAAQAQTIAALKSAGVLRAGVQISQAPWGFMDTSGRNEGFEIELLRAFSAEIGITPEFTPVTTSTRIPALLANKIDVIAAVMGIYPDRQKVVLFSRSYCNLDTVFIGKVGQSVKGWADLKGLIVGVPRGTPQDAAVSKAAPPEQSIAQLFDVGPEPETQAPIEIRAATEPDGGNVPQDVLAPELGLDYAASFECGPNRQMARGSL